MFAMQVDPMSRFNTTKMSNQSKVITLEGKTRLPLRLQEAIIDVGNIVNTAQSSSANGEMHQLPQLAKNFSVLETTMSNTLSVSSFHSLILTRQY
jgi:hypothetical protein